MNAARLEHSCTLLSSVAPPLPLFLDALRRLIKDNEEYVPPYESSGSLYIRPVVLGVGGQLGLHPSDEYLFLMYCTPVGGFYGSAKKVRALIPAGFDRAAPKGVGSGKLGNH